MAALGGNFKQQVNEGALAESTSPLASQRTCPYSFLMERNKGLGVFHSRRHAVFVENQFAANPPGSSSDRGIFASRLPLPRITCPDTSMTPQRARAAGGLCFYNEYSDVFWRMTARICYKAFAETKRPVNGEDYKGEDYKYDARE